MTGLITVLLLVAIVGGFFYLRRKSGSIGSLLSGWFEPDKKTTIRRLKDRTAEEEREAAELQKVLDAKKELMQAKAKKSKLKKEIQDTSEKSVDKGQGARLW